jgi:hypothetical protein
MTRRLGTRWRAALAVAGIAIASRAAAGLGERADAIAADRKVLAAEPRGAVAHERFTVERMESPANEVREYVSPSGVVFAVAWDGVSHPDLSALLASYAPEYRQALERSRTKTRRARRVRGERVVVETWGHMRSLHGRAFVPDLIPPGVSVDAIR